MRFCTVELKQKPLNKFKVENFYSKGIKFISLIGVRREESANRANRKFFEKYRFTYNRKGYWEYIVQPIVNWTTQQVFDYLKEKKIEPNPLYKRGFTRVGCMPCVFGNPKILLMAGDKYVKRLRDLEEEVSKKRGKKAKWFSPSKERILSEPMLFDYKELYEEKESD